MRAWSWFDRAALLTLVLLRLASGVEPVRVANHGIGGKNTRESLSRLERDVLQVKPRHLVVYLGMNDACNPRKLVPVDEFETNLQAMIDRSLAVGVQTIVLVTPNPVVDAYLALRAKGHPCGGKFQEWLNTYDVAIRYVAGRNSLPVADLRELCDARGGAAVVRDSLVRNRANAASEDGVHLTAEGYRRMAGLIASILEDKVQPGDVVVCFGDSITYGASMKGKGTAYGETYPAWLWLYLNRHIGATELETPPVLEDAESGDLVRNGDFELSEDGVHAIFWRGYKLSDTLAQDQPFSGGHYLRIRSRYPAPQRFWYTPEVKVSARGVYDYEFAVRGTGRIRPLIRQFGKGGFLGAFPPEGDDAWIQATGGWQHHEGNMVTVEGTRRILVMFQVMGDVALDAVSIREDK